MSYNILGPVKILNAQSLAASFTSVAVAVKNQDNIGIQLEWDGSPTGGFGVEISSNHLQDAEGNVLFMGDWVELPLDPMITATGSADDAYIDLNQMSTQYVRVTYTATSGSGSVSGVVVAKGV